MGEFVSYEGRMLYAPDFLIAQKLTVHAMITPAGQVLKCGSEGSVAYHAGASLFKGVSGLNTTFLGCEFLVSGEHTYESYLKRIAQPDAYTDAQYEAGGWLYASWMRKFGIARDAIVGHSAVSGDDVRGPGKGKRDPGGGFAWERFWESVDRWSV